MPCRSQDVHLEIHSRIEALDLVQAVTEHVARRVGFDDDSLHWAAMAVRESVINAITHGNGSDPSKVVVIEFTAVPEHDPVDLVVSVRDQGSGFDPAALKDPLTPDNMLKASGRGVFLMRQFMDDVAILRARDGGTEVRMRKRIHPH